MNNFLRNERIVKSYDPSEDWERRESMRGECLKEEIGSDCRCPDCEERKIDRADFIYEREREERMGI